MKLFNDHHNKLYFFNNIVCVDLYYPYKDGLEY